MKKDVNPVMAMVAVVVIVVLVVGGIAFYSNPHAPGDVKYTPGVPPWADKSSPGGNKTPDYSKVQGAAPPMAAPKIDR